MKYLMAAVALTIASPAFAQADPHAGHAGHEQHEKDCCKEKDADGTRKDCCDKAMKDGKAMACCEKHAKEMGKDAHAGHDMSKH